MKRVHFFGSFLAIAAVFHGAAHAALSGDQAFLAARSDAAAKCTEADGMLDGIGALTGWSTALGAVGAVSGAAAVATGLMKSSADANIKNKYAELQLKDQTARNEGGNKTVVDQNKSSEEASGQIIVASENLLQNVGPVSGTSGSVSPEFNGLEPDLGSLNAENIAVQQHKVATIAKMAAVSNPLSIPTDISLNVASGGDATGGAAGGSAQIQYGESIKDCASITDPAAEAECERLQGKSQALGTARVITAGVATGAVAGSTVTSAMAVKKLDDATAKVQECLDASNAVAVYRAQLTADDVAEGTDVKLTAVAAECADFDTDNLTGMKKLLTAAAITAGVGSATGIAGTVLSAMNKDAYQATGNEYREGKAVMGWDDKDQKMQVGVTTGGGAVAANVLNGITAATGAGATVMAAISGNGSMKARFNRLKDKIAKCRAALQ